ncbi:MAG: WXG100 family type VII secretion target [Ruminococcus sp.]|jgi:WXG100 family type VII secretion target
MDRELEVDTMNLNQKAARFAELALALEEDLEELRGSLMELNGSWEGDAARAFERQFQGDYETMKTVCETVKELQNTMEYAKGEYIRCEQAVEDTVAAIKI